MKAGEKTLLLADVGGTNTRMAVVRGGVFGDVRHFENSAFPTFQDLIDAYVQNANVGQVTGCSVAMAGPVRAGRGRLTNRNWQIASGDLAAHLGCADVLLMNDLTALGYAVSSLPKESQRVLDRPADGAPNGQLLVVGIGTGFNLCPVLQGADGGLRCLEVEMGHAALPAPLKEALCGHIGEATGVFLTLEDLFSGDGLARFHEIRTGGKRSAKDIVERHEAGDADAGETLGIYTKLLGVLCRQLAYSYMPMEGMYFAGSVARGVLRPEFHVNLKTGGADAGKVGNLVDTIPKSIILDDAAALRGCSVAHGLLR